MENNLLTTKEFADLCKTTKRTIIYYDQTDLLKPFKRSALNRLYKEQQILKFEKIVLLQSVGFSLTEIKQQIKNHLTLKEIFKKNKLLIAEKQKKINQQMQKVNEILNNLEKNNNILDPQVKKIKSFNFYAIEREGKYADIPDYCRELAKQINDKNHTFTYFIIFKEFFEFEYTPKKSIMIIGAKPLKNTRLSPKKNTLILHSPQHSALTSFHKGSHASLGYVWKFMWEYFHKHKLTYNQKIFIREVYLKGPENEKYKEEYMTQLQIPFLI